MENLWRLQKRGAEGSRQSVNAELKRKKRPTYAPSVLERSPVVDLSLGAAGNRPGPERTEGVHGGAGAARRGRRCRRSGSKRNLSN